MTDTQGSMDTAVTGSQAVTNSRIDFHLTKCSGVNSVHEDCPLKQYCKRAQLPDNPWRPLMFDAPFVWSDYMLIEQGYDPVYCEFYIYKAEGNGTTQVT